MPFARQLESQLVMEGLRLGPVHAVPRTSRRSSSRRRRGSGDNDAEEEEEEEVVVDDDICAVVSLQADCTVEVACPHLVIELADDGRGELTPHLESLFEFVALHRRTESGGEVHQGDSAAAGKCVLIHCSSGVSRSAAAAIAVVMRETRAPLREAYKLVHEKRPCVSPGPSLFRELQEFEAREGLWEEGRCDGQPFSMSASDKTVFDLHATAGLASGKTLEECAAALGRAGGNTDVAVAMLFDD